MAFTDAGQARLIFLDLPYGRDPRYRTVNAFLDASLANDSIQAESFGTNGKKRTLKIWHFPPDCSDDGTCSDNICDTGTKLQPTVESFDIDDCASSKVYALGIDDVRAIDGNMTFSDVAMRTLRIAMDNVRRKLDDKLNAWLVANVGDFTDGTASKTISLIDPTTGAIRPAGYFEIERAIQDAGLINPYIVGGYDVFTLQRGLSIGGLNQNGQRIEALQVANAYYDKGLESAFADTTNGHIVAFSALALKFIPFNNNAGIFANAEVTRDILESSFKMGHDYLFTSIPDALTGLLYDLDIVFDKCTKTWNMQIKLPFDVFKAPLGVCNDEPGVNGIFHFKTCVPVAVDCPDTPST